MVKFRVCVVDASPSVFVVVSCTVHPVLSANVTGTSYEVADGSETNPESWVTTPPGLVSSTTRNCFCAATVHVTVTLFALMTCAAVGDVIVGLTFADGVNTIAAE